MAAGYIDAIVTCCENLQTFPERGTRRDGLMPGLRITGYRHSAVIAFRIDAPTQTVPIMGVFYSGQDDKARFLDDQLPTLAPRNKA